MLKVCGASTCVDAPQTLSIRSSASRERVALRFSAIHRHIARGKQVWTGQGLDWSGSGLGLDWVWTGSGLVRDWSGSGLVRVWTCRTSDIIRYLQAGQQDADGDHQEDPQRRNPHRDQQPG
ncbi:hypothetical protein EYF80_035590 [Liparis tanakae]|uniref:Uncharacterized protein n=1 Tax=Liparis tanakae TaxID=230148 RepID=A0A4Z2GKV2_9TELE|nr:hypothetical protein EYF80_035590 [Liparis tanakae]